jgi:hypothetical protein
MYKYSPEYPLDGSQGQADTGPETLCCSAPRDGQNSRPKLQLQRLTRGAQVFLFLSGGQMVSPATTRGRATLDTGSFKNVCLVTSKDVPVADSNFLKRKLYKQGAIP